MTAEVQFVVTGFGPFRGCQNNPTCKIIEELLLTLQMPSSSSGSSTSDIPFTLVKTHIFKTSADSVQKEIFDLYQAFEQRVQKPHKATKSVMLHLGISTFARCFKIEQFAYNNATFCVPDENKYLPYRVKVEQNDEFGLQRETVLPLAQVVSQLSSISKDSLQQSEFQTSIDPGRFVCNFTYYKSLTHCELLNADRTDTHNNMVFYALFLHVPPLDVIPLKQQVNFILHLMRVISVSVTQNPVEGLELT